MIINDKVYGEIDITEPVIIELINSKAMQRLKLINQYGTWGITHPEYDTTRFEHSIGVYWLLKNFGAPIEEQVSGLLHDVSHGSFSHVLDYMFDQQVEQKVQDNSHNGFIMNTDIPSILRKYGFDVDYVLDENNFPLLENDLPDICADRIDYGLRDAVTIGVLNRENVKSIINELSADKEFVFKNKEFALLFSKAFGNCCLNFWAPPFQAFTFQMLADAMKIAVENGVLVKEDLFSTDSVVFEKLKNSEDEMILDKLKFIVRNLKIEMDENDFDYFIKSKPRFVDPKVLVDGDLVRLSVLNADYKNFYNESFDFVKKGYKIRIRGG